MTPLLLALTAVIAYSFGSLSTPILSSHIYFHENVLNYSRDNAGITRFLKRHGRRGVGVIVIIEALKVIIPVLLGSLLLLIVDRADIGAALALFCVVLGTNFPILYRFHGEHSLLAMAIGSFFISSEVAFAGVIVFVVVYLFSRYISLSALLSALMMFLVSVMSVDDSIVRTVYALTCLLVVIEYRKSILRLVKHKEKKFRYEEDVTYMFDDDYGSGQN